MNSAAGSENNQAELARIGNSSMHLIQRNAINSLVGVSIALRGLFLEPADHEHKKVVAIWGYVNLEIGCLITRVLAINHPYCAGTVAFDILANHQLDNNAFMGPRYGTIALFEGGQRKCAILTDCAACVQLVLNRQAFHHPHNHGATILKFDAAVNFVRLKPR